MDAQRAEGAADLQRIAGRIAVVGVDHQRGRVGKRRADRFDQADVLARAEADLHLDRAKALGLDRRGLDGEAARQVVAAPQHHAVAVHRNAVATAPPDKPVERLPGDLADDVPQGDVDARQGLYRHAHLPVVAQQVVDVMPDPLAVEGTGADHHRRDHALDNGLVGEGDIAGSEAFAPPGDPCVGLHLDEVGAAARIELLGIAELFVEVVLQDVALDGDDAHGASIGCIDRAPQWRTPIWPRCTAARAVH